jgi:hypothetical protein
VSTARSAAALALCLLAASGLPAQAPRAQGGRAQGPAGPDLAIEPGDIRLVPRDDGGYDLFLRKKPDIASVLLTESTKDPAMKADSFAYRAADYNEVNGGETRLLNGKPLPPASKLYSLISSTPRPDADFGQAFRILVPPVLVYGYAWSRSGTVSIGKGTFINIRAFAKPYADYSGPFRDNPYEIAVSVKEPPPVVQAPPPKPEPIQQKPEPPPPPDDRTSSKIAAIIDEGGKSLDLVVCLDTTESMVPYIDDLKKNLGPILRERIARFESFRIGIVLFKDYWPDEYITRKFPFTADIAAFEKTLRGIIVFGGRDIPEAEFEALYSAATDFDWKADRRQVVLVTDAPPHTARRGAIGFTEVIREARARKIEADAIIEPATIAPPNPSHAERENVDKRLGILAAADPGIKPYDGGVAKAFADDDAAIAAARAAGSGCVVVQGEESLGALRETVTRLLEVPSGKVLDRDVSWRATSFGVETLFVNGSRVR